MILVVDNDKRMTYLAQELAKKFLVIQSKAAVPLMAVTHAVLPFKADPNEMRMLVNQLPDDCVIFTPIARDFLTHIKQPVVVMMDADSVAIYNSIPTAEGVLYHLIKNTETTIHNANVHVIGAGRCGETLAKTLQKLGAKVSVSSRNPKLVARLFESGIKTKPLDEAVLKEADVIVNTVPAMMLGKEQLELVKKDVYIADIASGAGGVDFEAAEKLGVLAELLPALPGIVAPKTAAHYLAAFIGAQIKENAGEADE